MTVTTTDACKTRKRIAAKTVTTTDAKAPKSIAAKTVTTTDARKAPKSIAATVTTADARKTLKSIAAMTRSLLALDDALGAVETIDLLGAQKQTQLADTEKLVVAAVARLDDLEAKGAEKRVAVQAAVDEAARIGDAAKAEAAAMRAKAESDVDTIIASARAAAARMADEARTARDAVQAKVTDLQATMATLRQEIADDERRRDTVKDEIARIKRLMTEG